MRLLATTYLHYSSKAKGKGTYAPSEVPVASVARHAMTLRMRTVTAMRRATLCLIPNRRFRLEPGCVGRDFFRLGFGSTFGHVNLLVFDDDSLELTAVCNHTSPSAAVRWSTHALLCRNQASISTLSPPFPESSIRPFFVRSTIRGSWRVCFETSALKTRSSHMKHGWSGSSTMRR